MDPNDYVGRRQDGVWDEELKRTLKSSSEAVRLDFLLRVLLLQEERGLGTQAWFKLAGAVLTEQASFEKVLRTGLGIADASTIRNWLQFSSAHIGCRRLIRLLEDEEANRPKEVSRTHYWLRSLAQSPNERRIIDDYLATRTSA